MKNVKTAVIVPIRVVRNTAAASPNHQWAKIVNAQTNAVLHTGQIGYIRKVAKKRYNVKAAL